MRSPFEKGDDSAIQSARIGNTLRQYRIVGVIGKGGMGEVYAADDIKLNRRVALKLLPSDMVADAMRLHRFAREAQAIAALNHPNVVTIYGVDEADGIHFIAMELVDGRPLSEVIPGGGFAFDDFLELAIPLTDAIGAAHERGVIHRDLKPANIIVTNDRRVKVLDFGLAKLRQEPSNSAETTMTAAGQLTADQHIIGTAAYMSPEQAQGEHLDHRTDIFSLGIVMYEMATGRRPFSGTTPISMISSIVKDTPAPLADVKPSMPAELDRILRRCLAKDPSRRFQSAIDLRNELEDLRTSKAAPRRRVPIGWIALPIAAAAIAIAIWKWPVHREAAPNISFAQLTGDPGAELYPSISPDGKWVVYTGESEGNRDVFLQSVSGEKPINLTKDSPDDDEEPAFSPDGERIAFRSNRGGGGIFVMGRTGEAVKRVTTSGFNPSWSPDGSQIVYASERIEVNPQNSQGISTLWTVNANGGAPQKLNSGPDATQPKFSPHNRRIAYMARLVAGQVDVWTMSVDGKSRVAVTHDLPTDWSPFWSPDGKFLYFCSDRGGSMNLWRVPIDEESGRTLGAPQPVTTPAAFVAHPSISADGARIAYSSVVRSANIQMLPLDPAAGKVAGEPAWVTTGTRSWSSPDPSPDGQWVAFYSIIQPEGHLYVVRSNGTELRQLTSDSAIDRMPRWSPDGKWLAFFSNRSGPLEIWKMRPDGGDLQRLTALGSTAYTTWPRDGSFLIAELTSGKVLRLDPNRTYEQQKAEILDVHDAAHALLPNSLTSDNRTLAVQVGPVSFGVGTFNIATRQVTMMTNFGEWPVWLPDDRHILFVARGKEFWIVDTVTKETRKIFSVTRDVVGPPRLTRDGRNAFYSRRITEADVWVATLSDTAGTSPASR